MQHWVAQWGSLREWINAYGNIINAVGVLLTLVLGIITIRLAWLIYNRQRRESMELMTLFIGRIITALIVADVIPRDREEQAKQVAAGEVQRYSEGPGVTTRLEPEVIDELIRRGSGEG